MLTSANTDAPSGEPAALQPPEASLPAVQPDLPVLDAPATGPLLAPPAPDPGSLPMDNPKHELFCEHVTGWGGTGDPVTGSEAYAKAYGIGNGPTARVNASRLAARADIRARCVWMRSQLASTIMLDKSAVRGQLFNMRMNIILKTKDTCHKDVALAAARDIERSLGIDGPEVSSTTTTEAVSERSASAVSEIGLNVEAIAAAIIRQRQVTTVTVKQ